MISFIRLQLKAFKYPKIALFGLCVILAYALLQNHSLEWLIDHLNHHGYATVFLAGCLFSYGFTAPLSVALMIELSGKVDWFYGALIGAVGALISDYCIFSWVKFSMQDEFDRLKSTRPLRWIHKQVSSFLRPKIQKYATLALALMIIGSPLPDEIGVSLLSGFGNIDKYTFAVMGYTANAAGIAVLLALV